MIQKLIAWLTLSSQNPENIALTLKGILIAAIPWVVTAFGLVGHITLSSDALTVDANALVSIVQQGLIAIGAVIAAYGLVRKLINTFVYPNSAAQVAANSPIV